MKSTRLERERQDWAIVLLILLIGFLCVAVAGQWALRLSPSWELDTNMQSNIDPNGKVPTGRPVNFIEPLDPGILTKPSWEGLFTPGVHFVTRTPLPPPADTNTAPAESPIPATIPATTNTVFVTDTVVPTNTFVWLPLPAATATHKPKKTKEPTDTPTSVPLVSANLSITNDDGVITYVANGTLIYTVTVTNNGPGDVIGAVVTDPTPAQITNWQWDCIAQNGGATGCDAQNGHIDFSDTVNLPNGASIVYTVTADISPVATGDLINTASISLPAGYTGPTPVSATDTDTL